MPFENLESCIDMVPRLLQMAAVPTAIEFLERELIDIVERNLHKLLPVKEGDAVLIVMYDAGSEQELCIRLHRSVGCGTGSRSHRRLHC